MSSSHMCHTHLLSHVFCVPCKRRQISPSNGTPLGVRLRVVLCGVYLQFLVRLPNSHRNLLSVYWPYTRDLLVMWQPNFSSSRSHFGHGLLKPPHCHSLNRFPDQIVLALFPCTFSRLNSSVAYLNDDFVSLATLDAPLCFSTQNLICSCKSSSFFSKWVRWVRMCGR